MKRALIIHGWGADSQSNWFPWLKKELERNGWNVAVPNFPNTENPKLEEWLEHFQSVVATLVVASSKAGTSPATTVLIGHSLGVPFILRYLEHVVAASYAATNRRERNAQLQFPITACYLVSGFDRSLTIAEIENFVDKPFDWDSIRSACKKFVVIDSDNDPYIPFEIGKDLASKLEADFVVEHGGGHLNSPGGFLEYPKLLNLILPN